MPSPPSTSTLTISRDDEPPVPPRTYPKRVVLPEALRTPIPAPGNFADLGLAMAGHYLPAPLPPFSHNASKEHELTPEEAAAAVAAAQARELGLPLSAIEEQRILEAVEEMNYPPAEFDQVLARARRIAAKDKYERNCRLAERRSISKPWGFQLELAPDELAELSQRALLAARRKKYLDAYAHWAWAKGLPFEFPATLTAEQYLTLFKARADWHVQHQPDPKPQFDIDDDNRLQIWLLCLYFAQDKRFETEYGYRLNRNLMLRGPVGCGKSTILEMFRSNHRQSFQSMSCRKITDAYQAKEGGPAAKAPYYGMATNPNKAKNWAQPRLGWAFDDLGTEDYGARHMGGNPCNVMADILTQRWDTGHTLAPGSTHFTTNLSWPALEATYHERLYSRLRGAFNDIKFPTAAPDRRRL